MFTSAPAEVVDIYDNDEALDRYSIHLVFNDGYSMLVRSADNAMDAAYVEEEDFDVGYLGKKIEWDDLPEVVQAFVWLCIYDYECSLKAQEKDF